MPPYTKTAPVSECGVLALYYHETFVCATKPKGFHSKIIFGSTVRAAKRAMNIAAPVNTPKMSGGMKFDIIKMENPKMTVKVV